mmetsp:Transcript_21020/g.49452  ORF Transcript_21020/g.49452 Transcript_21020/m.49452 type:complete len:87 (-) Transcript_21020:16-276(-)
MFQRSILELKMLLARAACARLLTADVDDISGKPSTSTLYNAPARNPQESELVCATSTSAHFESQLVGFDMVVFKCSFKLFFFKMPL